MTKHLPPDHDEATVCLSNHSRPRKEGKSRWCLEEKQQQKELQIPGGSTHSQPERRRPSLSGGRRRQSTRRLNSSTHSSVCSGSSSSSPGMPSRRSLTKAVASPRSKSSIYLPQQVFSVDLLHSDYSDEEEDDYDNQDHEASFHDSFASVGSAKSAPYYSIPLADGNGNSSPKSASKSGRSRSQTRRGGRKSVIIKEEKVSGVRRWSANDFEPQVKDEQSRSLSRERRRNSSASLCQTTKQNYTTTILKEEPLLNTVKKRWSSSNFHPELKETTSSSSLSRERRRNSSGDVRTRRKTSATMVDSKNVQWEVANKTVDSKNARWEVTGAERDQQLFLPSSCQQSIFAPMRKSTLTGSRDY